MCLNRIIMSILRKKIETSLAVLVQRPQMGGVLILFLGQKLDGNALDLVLTTGLEESPDS